MSENDELKAGIVKIKGIFVGDTYFFQIPDYQRPYSWDKDQVSELIDDFTNAFNNNKEENYFCGSLVLVNDGTNKRYDVIDGQQRLTTLVILSCVLRDFFVKNDSSIDSESKDWIESSIYYAHDKKKFRIRTSEENQNSFEHDIIKGIQEDSKDQNNNQYLQNAFTIKKLLEEKIKYNDINNINDWIKFIFNNVVITKIECNNQETAIQIFNVLNTRGMPLSSADIIKSELMQSLTNEDKTSFVAVWNKINSSLEVHDLSYNDLLTTYSDFLKPQTQKKSVHVDLRSVFKDKDSNKIINTLKDFSQSYIEIVGKDSNDAYIYCLHYLSHSRYWQSILTVAHYKKVPYYDELKKALLSYYYQNWISGGTASTIKVSSYKILKCIQEDKSISDIKKCIHESLERNNMINRYKKNIEKTNVYNKTSWIKPTLLLLEYFYKDSSNQPFLENTKKNQIEHIFPQNPKQGAWNFTTEEAKECLHSLGNLTLLLQKKNNEAANLSFQDKKKAYTEGKDNQATSFELTRRVFKNKKWTPDTIRLRTKELIKKLDEIFKL